MMSNAVMGTNSGPPVDPAVAAGIDPSKDKAAADAFDNAAKGHDLNGELKALDDAHGHGALDNKHYEQDSESVWGQKVGVDQGRHDDKNVANDIANYNAHAKSAGDPDYATAQQNMKNDMQSMATDMSNHH